MTISARIAYELRVKGITQKAMSEKLNITPSTLNTWIKSDSKSIPSAYIMPICRILDMTPEELLEGAEHVEVNHDIPDDYVQLSENEMRLIKLFRALDDEGQIVVLNTAIVEKRQLTRGAGRFEKSEKDMGVS